VKYTNQETAALIDRLKSKQEAINEQVKAQDLAIFQYFHHLANQQGKAPNLLEHYRLLIEFDRAFGPRHQLYNEMVQGTEFLNVQTPYEEIESNLQALQRVEQGFKAQIRQMLEESIYQAALSPGIRAHFEQYCAQEWVYFTSLHYHDEALSVLFEAIHGYNIVLRETYFNLKKELLVFQAQLLDAK
jgi:hypothetical protein